MEGTGNPAFNMSSPDLSAQQSSEKKVIRHDTRDRTLAAHQQKCRLQASAEPKGVTSGLIIFTLGDSRCAPALTWASWSRHPAFHASVSAQASREALAAMRWGTLRIRSATGRQTIVSYGKMLGSEPTPSHGAELERVQSQDMTLWCRWRIECWRSRG